MEQSSVEWLVQEINKINVSTEARRFINKLEKQAKVMEKQQQRYSEEEVLELLLNRPGTYLRDNEIKEWFEQCKKK